MTDPRSRPLRAVLRNAVTWGAGWGMVAGAFALTLGLFYPGAGAVADRLVLAIAIGAYWAVRIGVIGAVIGAAFSGAIRLSYRGLRLADIDRAGFVILGALVGGVGVPLVLQLMHVLSGDGLLSWSSVLGGVPWAMMLGGTAAGGSILLGRRADALPNRGLIR